MTVVDMSRWKEWEVKGESGVGIAKTSDDDLETQKALLIINTELIFVFFLILNDFFTIIYGFLFEICK